MKPGHDVTGVLFWNYSEDGDHYDNPNIEIVKERFLVFSRGGLSHSLYDLKTKAVLVNDESPWGSFEESWQFKNMDAWVRSKLHQKIERIVKGGR